MKRNKKSGKMGLQVSLVGRKADSNNNDNPITEEPSQSIYRTTTANEHRHEKIEVTNTNAKEQNITDKLKTLFKEHKGYRASTEAKVIEWLSRHKHHVNAIPRDLIEVPDTIWAPAETNLTGGPSSNSCNDSGNRSSRNYANRDENASAALDQAKSKKLSVVYKVNTGQSIASRGALKSAQKNTHAQPHQQCDEANTKAMLISTDEAGAKRFTSQAVCGDTKAREDEKPGVELAQFYDAEYLVGDTCQTKTNREMPDIALANELERDTVFGSTVNKCGSKSVLKAKVKHPIAVPAPPAYCACTGRNYSQIRDSTADPLPLSHQNRSRGGAALRGTSQGLLMQSRRRTSTRFPFDLPVNFHRSLSTSVHQLTNGLGPQQQGQHWLGCGQSQQRISQQIVSANQKANSDGNKLPQLNTMGGCDPDTNITVVSGAHATVQDNKNPPSRGISRTPSCPMRKEAPLTAGGKLQPTLANKTPIAYHKARSQSTDWSAPYGLKRLHISANCNRQPARVSRPVPTKETELSTTYPEYSQDGETGQLESLRDLKKPPLKKVSPKHKTCGS